MGDDEFLKTFSAKNLLAIKVRDELDKETDRGCCLMAVSYLS